MPRRILISIALVVGSLSVAPLVGAEDDPNETLREARQEREQGREDRADLARQLNVLEATDEELIAALDALTEQVLAQEQEVTIARAAVADALTGEAAVQDQIVATQAQVANLRFVAQDRLVAAYVAPRADPSSERDITLLARREALFRYVDLDGRDLMDQLRSVEDDLDLLFIEASRQRDAAISLQADLESALQQLNNDVAAQELVRAELAEVIEHVETEIAAMAAAEAEITAVIRDAQREVARQAALAWAATSSTTSTTTSTTTAPSDNNDTTGDDGSDSGSTTNTGTTTTTQAPDLAIDPANLNLIWPTTGRITSTFGTRVHPITGRTTKHSGLDIANIEGAPIWSAQSGTVIFSGRMSGYGETVMLDHGSGVTTLYAHMSKRTVQKGASVVQGGEVGKVGSTGYSTGNHLHFEVRLNGAAANPQAYLP